MRLSTKGEYASRAMLELSRRYEDGPVHSWEISKAQEIPQRFLEQILLLLKRAGYLKSRKGQKGGYVLAKPPGEINVAEVIRVMDGPLAPIDCVSVMAHETCSMERTCGLRWLWKDVRDAVAGILERTTFADLVARSRPAADDRGGGRKTASPVRKAALVLLAAASLAGFGRAEEKKDSPLMAALSGLKLAGYAQVFGAAWDPGVDTFSLRRARMSLGGEIVKNLRFKIAVDLIKSPALIDALVEFAPARAAGLRFGQFLVPFSLDSVTSVADIDMVNRPAVVEALAPGRDISAAGRDVGAVLFGAVSIAEYAFGFVNGAGINKPDEDGHKDVCGRLVLRPFAPLAVGGSLYRGKRAAVEDGPLVARDREGLEAALAIGRLSFKGEYIHARDGLVSKSGWYALAGVFAVPGKLQALARFDSLDLDRGAPDDGRTIVTAGLNWLIIGKTKLQLNYEVHRLEAGGRDKSGLLAQFQAAF
jgi:Rrf2 family transcriptional regulator, cysteine metabolism repressor